MIEAMNSFSDVSEPKYLDITELVEGGIYERVALVTSADAGTTKTNSGFARFFLKDINANVVCARLFDVQDFSMCGIKLSSFKNKPVILKFVAQEFNGSLSLVIDGSYGIKVYDKPINLERFIGKIECDEQSIRNVGKNVFGDEWDINPEWKIVSCSIGQGRVGAITKVCDLALANISGYEGMPGINMRDLIIVLFETMNTLFHSEKNKNTYGVLDDVKNFDYLMSLNQKWYNDNLKGVIMDASKAIMGISKPAHIYSHLVVRAINQAIENLDLILVNNSMVFGTSSWTGGVRLSKY